MNKPLLFPAMAFCLLAILSAQPLSAQYRDSLQQEKVLKNTIRYNLSSPLLFGFNYVVFGYERVLRPYQTFSINAGVTALPNVISLARDSFKLVKAGNDPGFNLALDYRFYFKNENRHPAPRGVYLAPFYAFNNYKRTDSWLYDDGSGFNVFFEPKINLNIHSLGGQLGYQFVIARRFTVDLILIGPSLSFYKLNVQVASEATIPEDEALEAVLELIKELVPGFERVFEGEELSVSGTLNTRFLGFRYLIHVGYRF